MNLSNAEILSSVQHQILEQNGMQLSHLEQAMQCLQERSIDSADLYFQAHQQESWVLENGIIREGQFHQEQGVGVRAINGEKTGFAYAGEFSDTALMEAAANARSIARAGQHRSYKLKSRSGDPTRYVGTNPLSTLEAAQKVEILRSIDQLCRSLDPRVEQVIASLTASYEHILVFASDDTLAADIRPLVRCNVTVLVQQNGRREQGSAGGGGRYGYDYFLQEDRYQQYCHEAVRQALTSLEAVDAPAGSMPVVLGAGWPGVLLHEAVGHGLEGDFNRKGTSMFSGQMGQQVASPQCTVVDDGTLQNRRGSLRIDDEGTPTQCTTLIENGILTGYMQDKHNAHLMGQKSTGNGRRESYAHLPMPRMTNTYMLAGDSEQEEMIASIDRGIFAVNFGGGQVDITSGKFVFSLSEAYLIDKGKITAPVKGATLIGSGAEVMRSISMVGNDLALDSGIGVCGKEGQSVPVGVGQPSLKIDSITVGGTAS